ncbi:DNA-directed RNA polymerase sigma-70 factor [Adhaeribacter aerolatus]|uniref:DNA-directed RNA polymerase sigma-70 factor n=1 Tax=Adhaeribacter aerolatus TaxID=670289 RepID=A0A512B226_9BACT|nr:RNA polymerase sigma-70 factor [Adhaeribacter aerolatus]GEO06011.1 DNA-directed RNA polymerase sigma-70 factor [Adhaeribacter aerolatus]
MNIVSYHTLADQVLFDLVKSEDEAAFKEIYERYFDVLYIHAYKRLQNKEEAQDVIQEVFAALWDKREHISLTSSLPAYLFTAVRNRILNNLAHRKYELSYLQSLQQFINQGVCQTDHLVRENQLQTLIEKEIAALPPKMQEVFSLSRNAHLSHKEIAAELNLSEQTVKKQVNNALRILRTKLGLLIFLYFLFNKNF